MITIEQLEFSNMFSYGSDNVVKLNGATVTQILGTNGAGKSSLALILEDALYNKNSKGIKKGDIKNRNFPDDPAFTKVIFSVGMDNYILEKTVRSTTKVKLLKNKEDISGHTATQTYKALQDILQLDFNTFSKLVYQSTQSSLDFLTATDANRKKFLVSLLGLEYLAEIELHFKELNKATAKELAEIKGRVGTIKSWLDSNQTISYIEEVEVPEFPEELQERVVQAKAKQQASTLSNKKAEQNLLSQQKLQKHKSQEPAPTEDVSKELSEVTRELSGVRGVKAKLKKDFDTLKGKPDKCPTCGQSVDNSEARTAMKSIKQEFDELKKIEETLKVEQERLGSIDIEYTRRKSWETKLEVLQASYNPEESCDLVDTAALSKEITSLTNEINSIKYKIDEANKHNRSAVANNARCDQIIEQTSKYKTDLQNLQEQLDELQELSNDLETLVKAFGNKGLVAYKIESMLKLFEEVLNRYLSTLSEGRFNLGFEIEGDKLKVALYDNSTPIDIKSLSSGELNRVNTSTLLAVRKLMSSASKVHINCLILDEVISTLDDEGFSSLVDTLFIEHGLNSFVVSHGRTADPRVSRLEIKKKNGVSKVYDG